MPVRYQGGAVLQVWVGLRDEYDGVQDVKGHLFDSLREALPFCMHVLTSCLFVRAPVAVWVSGYVRTLTITA